MIELIHGNCLDYLEKIECDCVITDPPYGLGMHKVKKGGRTRCRDAWRIPGDQDQSLGQHVADWAARRNLPAIFFAAPSKPLLGKWADYLVWDKGPAVGAGGDTRLTFKRTWELIQVARPRRKIGPRGPAVWRFPVNSLFSKRSGHIAAKPVDLLKRLIEVYVGDNEVIFDPFMGSGSLAVAAKLAKKPYIGIEIDQSYFDIAQKRVDECDEAATH